jgi:hypothetical protein
MLPFYCTNKHNNTIVFIFQNIRIFYIYKILFSANHTFLIQPWQFSSREWWRPGHSQLLRDQSEISHRYGFHNIKKNLGKKLKEDDELCYTIILISHPLHSESLPSWGLWPDYLPVAPPPMTRTSNSVLWSALICSALVGRGAWVRTFTLSTALTTKLFWRKNYKILERVRKKGNITHDYPTDRL